MSYAYVLKINIDNDLIDRENPDCLGPAQTRVKKQETRNKKQNGIAHLRFLVCVTPKQRNTLLDSRIKFFIETCVKQPINNLSQVTWLCAWLAK